MIGRLLPGVNVIFRLTSRFVLEHIVYAVRDSLHSSDRDRSGLVDGGLAFCNYPLGMCARMRGRGADAAESRGDQQTTRREDQGCCCYLRRPEVARSIRHLLRQRWK